MAKAYDIVGDDYVMAILDSFGGLRPMAKYLDLGVSTVQGWKQRGKIPANRLEDIAKAAKAHNLILPDSFTHALKGDSRMNPKNLAKMVKKAEKSAQEKHIESPSDDASIAPLERGAVYANPEIEESSDDQNDSNVFHERSGRSPAPPSVQDEDTPKAALPKSTVAHWALLLSFIALLGVVTRPLWSEGIDSKLQSRIGSTHGEDGGAHGEAGDVGSVEVAAVLERLALLEEKVEVVEQANANLALLSFNLQSLQDGEGGSVFGQGGTAGMTAEELKRFESTNLDVEILKKDSITRQVQIDSLSGLLNQLEENSRIISRRLEGVENESGRLFERNFDRSIGTLYTLERLDARIRNGLAYHIQLADFDNLAINSEYRGDIVQQIEILSRYAEEGITALPILVQQYSDFLYPVLVAKTDNESLNWKEQIWVRFRSLVHFKRQKNIEDLDGLLRAEYLLSQGNLDEAIDFAESDIELYGQDTLMIDWLRRAVARRDALQAIDHIRLTIGENIIDSIRDLQKTS